MFGKKNSTCFENNDKTNVDNKCADNSKTELNRSRVRQVVKNRKPSMDVTKANFIEVLRQIDSVIAGSDFISIDTEFTGLKRPDAKSLQVLDTIEERYTKLKQSISGFNIIQIGVNLF